MKSLKLMLGAVLVSGLVLAGAAAPVQATEATQEQSQELKVKCQVGSYGQDTTCEAEGKQEQKQTIKVLGKTHEVVDTALDLQTSLTAGGVMLSSVGAFVLKRKLNK